MRTGTLVTCGLMVAMFSGCGVKEIRSKTKFGPEFRHSGLVRTSRTRWTAQQGIEFKWEKGVTTSMTYRRRDTDNGNGNNDNGVWFEVSFPLWKAEPKPDKNAARIRELERRLAALEADRPVRTAAGHATADVESIQN